MKRTAWVIVLMAAWVLTAQAAPRKLASFDEAAAFAGEVERSHKGLTGKTIRVTFRDKRIQQQVFRKVKRRKRWRNILFFSRAAYGNGALFFDGVIYAYVGQRRPYQKFPQVRCDMPFAVPMPEARAREAVRAADLLALDVEVTGRIERVRKNGTDNYTVTLREPTVRLLTGGRVIFSGRGRPVEARQAPPPNASPATGHRKLKTRTVLEMEAEDATSLIWYADWQRDEKGWYAREITRKCSGRGIAVAHH